VTPQSCSRGRPIQQLPLTAPKNTNISDLLGAAFSQKPHRLAGAIRLHTTAHHHPTRLVQTSVCWAHLSRFPLLSLKSNPGLAGDCELSNTFDSWSTWQVLKAKGHARGTSSHVGTGETEAWRGGVGCSTSPSWLLGMGRQSALELVVYSMLLRG